jgi:hypothetical protein
MPDGGPRNRSAIGYARSPTATVRVRGRCPDGRCFEPNAGSDASGGHQQRCRRNARQAASVPAPARGSDKKKKKKKKNEGISTTTSARSKQIATASIPVRSDDHCNGRQGKSSTWVHRVTCGLLQHPGRPSSGTAGFGEHERDQVGGQDDEADERRARSAMPTAHPANCIANPLSCGKPRSGSRTSLRRRRPSSDSGIVEAR